MVENVPLNLAAHPDARDAPCFSYRHRARAGGCRRVRLSETYVLTENDIVDATAAHLASVGYDIESKCSTGQRGVDIIAVHRQTGRRLLVEAKR